MILCGIEPTLIATVLNQEIFRHNAFKRIFML